MHPRCQLLLYAVDAKAPQHEASAAFMEDASNASRRVAISWQSVTAFIRIASHPRISDRPLTADEAWAYVHDWLDVPVTWIPAQTEVTAREHGLTVVTHDSDFAALGVPTLDPVG